MAIICGSLNLLVFIKISSIIKPEKILLLKPINWRGDYHVSFASVAVVRVNEPAKNMAFDIIPVKGAVSNTDSDMPGRTYATLTHQPPRLAHLLR
jgi:hypothetical protein